ncbi:hypothetical protein [Saccharopolyspora taberi]|uniref:NYN domain-containing protein n=1 Tax=Saccharopolyspora taberi TaxID=60895 RepID=A0ABN3VF80_9PSEU
MNADDRVALLDLENLGAARLRPRPLRARLEALLAVAGDIHHAAAAYALSDGHDTDPVASVLAELRIAPLRVPPGPDAAELALLAHARHVHSEGGRTFLVGSADGRFYELVALGRVELLVWDGQPVATKLAEAVHHIHRLTRPSPGIPSDEPAGPAHSELTAASPIQASESPTPRCGLAARLLTAIATGAGIALGHRVLDTLLPRKRR